MDNRPQPDLDEACRVKPADLQHLAVLRETLALLNDAFAGAGRIAECIEKMPVLKARVRRRFAQGGSSRSSPSLAENLARLGNRGFEKLLLELLEDLTMLRGELDDAAERQASIVPAATLSKPAPGRSR